MQEKHRIRHNAQQESHFKLWDTQQEDASKTRKHNYNKTNFELNDYVRLEPQPRKNEALDKRNSNNITAALREEQVIRDRTTQKLSTQQEYVSNVKKLFDSFYEPQAQKKRQDYSNEQQKDTIMQMNGSSIQALETGKESLKEDLGQYFATQGGARKIKPRTQQVSAQADNIAQLKCHQEQ